MCICPLINIGPCMPAHQRAYEPIFIKEELMKPLSGSLLALFSTAHFKTYVHLGRCLIVIIYIIKQHICPEIKNGDG